MGAQAEVRAMTLTLWRRSPARTTATVATTLLLLIGGIGAAQSGREAKATSDDSPYDVPVAVDENPDPDVIETTIIANEPDGVDIGDGELANVLDLQRPHPRP